jgi:hypothetical protein
MSFSPASWTYTACTPSRPDDDALVVCCLSPSLLGIDALVEEVVARCGEEEGQRWQRARAEEYGSRLLDTLRMHMPTAELIVHLEEDDTLEKVRVIVADQHAADPARRQAELIDRVGAIRQRTWLEWWNGLQTTMVQLRHLDERGLSSAYREKAA